MIETSKCPECGATLPADPPEGGLCPSCLMRLAAASDAGSGAPRPTLGMGEKPEDDIPPGVLEGLPKIEILERLGAGGMGIVYKARQIVLDRIVAIKILPATAESDPDFAERFAREARALARLNHPNIIGIFEFGEAGGRHHLIMEYVDGVNLREVLRRGRMAPKEALAIIPQICDALEYAHRQGIVHRDIKPENIMIDREGRVKIADFGLAKMLGADGSAGFATGKGQVVGTPRYMAPEQIEHPTEVDHRADIFSLGVVFYELLTGELPMGRFDPPSSKVQIDVRLDEVVLKTLEKEPDRRYQHASEVKTGIEFIGANVAPGYPAKRYRSQRTFMGWPMMEYASGWAPGEMRGHARAVIAVGDSATGLIAIGERAQGLIAIGGRAIGVVAFGGIPIGLVAVGGLPIGLAAAGGIAMGLYAAGGIALGAILAYGGLAVGYKANTPFTDAIKALGITGQAVDLGTKLPTGAYVIGALVIGVLLAAAVRVAVPLVLADVGRRTKQLEAREKK